MPYAAIVAVKADTRNLVASTDESMAYQPFMVMTSADDDFKGPNNPLRPDTDGPEETMRTLFDLTLLKSLMVNTTVNEYIR